MIYFTSDWHLGEDRLGLSPDKPNLFFRKFKSIDEQNKTIINNFNSLAKKDDVLIHVGDVCYNSDYLDLLNEINCKNKILVAGNYDEDKLERLKKYFNKIHSSYNITYNNISFYIDHYPIRVKDVLETGVYDFGITGHVHGAWRFQRNMVNVSVDAWNFYPISLNELLFLKNAIDNHYDENVFITEN